MLKLNEVTKEQTGKVFIYMIIDVICILFSFLAGIGLWYDGSIPGAVLKAVPDEIWHWYFVIGALTSLIGIIIYSLFNFYNNLWKYASIDEIFKIIIAETIVFVIVFGINYFITSSFIVIEIPKRLLFVALIINIVLFVFSRFGYRIFKRFFNIMGLFIAKKVGYKRVLIIGAGHAGNNVIRNINYRERGYEDRLPVLVVDDDLKKNNTHINGIRVVSGLENLPELVRSYKIDEIIIAIPSAKNAQIKRIMNICTQTDCALKMIPPLSDISNGFNYVVRDVNISDLLFRDEIQIDIKSISGYLKNNVVLVTGGGGSIGSELCRQIAKFLPKMLIIFDIYENNAYELLNELKEKYNNAVNIVVKIGSVRDLKCLEQLFNKYKPSVIFHAAAHKHVSLMEECPCEAVKNNIFGTKNVVFCADKYGADRFVLLSTDKAVNPTSVMGATKRVTELLVQNMAFKSKTKFMVVRFGNVLGSNGSVIPIFQKQIEKGGPVTVTHPEVVRYFMTITEASQLVLQAAGIGKSGKIFVLDMGEPVKINDLAYNLIKLSGYIPDKDIKITYTGLKPGEKLFEELIMKDEMDDMKVTYHNKIFVTKPVEINMEDFEKRLKKLHDAAYKGASDEIIKLLCEVLPNFKHTV